MKGIVFVVACLVIQGSNSNPAPLPEPGLLSSVISTTSNLLTGAFSNFISSIGKILPILGTQNAIKTTSDIFSSSLDYIEEGLRTNNTILKKSLKNLILDIIVGSTAINADTKYNTFFTTIGTILQNLDKNVTTSLNNFLAYINQKTSNDVAKGAQISPDLTKILNEFSANTSIPSNDAQLQACVSVAKDNIASSQEIYISLIQYCDAQAVSNVNQVINDGINQLPAINQTTSLAVTAAQKCIADVTLLSSITNKTYAKNCLNNVINQLPAAKNNVELKAIAIQDQINAGLSNAKSQFNDCNAEMEQLLPVLMETNIDEIRQCYKS